MEVDPFVTVAESMVVVLGRDENSLAVLEFGCLESDHLQFVDEWGKNGEKHLVMSGTGKHYSHYTAGSAVAALMVNVSYLEGGDVERKFD